MVHFKSKMPCTMLFSHLIWCLNAKKGYGWLSFEDYIRMVELEILRTQFASIFMALIILIHNHQNFLIIVFTG